MIRWILYSVVLFAILTLVYIALSAYGRWDRRRRLEAEYDAQPVAEGEREFFVAQGLARYDKSFKRKLLLGVYGLPLFTFLALIIIAYLD